MKPIKIKLDKNELLKHSKLILIAALIIAALVVVMIGPGFSSMSFKIEDKCGNFVNLASHTVNDEDACKIRCRAQCESAEKRFRKMEFKTGNSGCNSCMCYCK